MNFKKNKKLITVMTFILCFSMLLAGCTDVSSYTSEEKRQEHQAKQDVEAMRLENSICSKVTISSAKGVYRDFTDREELSETLTRLLGSGVEECMVTLHYTYKFDPTVLKEYGYEVEYPDSETGYYQATVTSDVDKIDYNRLYEWIADKNVVTVSIAYWKNGENQVIDHG